MSDLTAFVLAGGKSTRMGRDKAFLPWADGTLLSHALKLLAAVTPHVHIVGDPKKFAPFGAAIADVYPDRGPLAGIHAALSSTRTDLNLMLAVDLPLIEPRFLQFMIGVAQDQDTDAIVTVPRADGVSQPLCAVYRREFAQAAERSLQAGKNKIDSLFRTVKTRIVEQDEVTRAGFSIAMFRNLNTPEEWQEEQRRSSPVT
ncbi:MAG TPA: molybdenum cofactor guanylyltransferase [Terriglobales bacterium]|jgi:molybdopterin-guanine dinucleotide biosynthesis protein A|nr:molybdenum cofactor guanylyltransferase [Terriglobales bacterium]